MILTANILPTTNASMVYKMLFGVINLNSSVFLHLP
ncbi:MAG: hypothetical protein ACI9LM_004845 [Alteromonadaceae bacterium]